MVKNKDDSKPQVVRLGPNYKVAKPYEEKFTINYPARMLTLTNRSITFDELFKYLPNAIIRHDPDNITEKYNEKSIKPPANKTDKRVKSQ